MTRRPSPSATPSLRRVAVVAALVTVTCPLAACGSGNTQSWVGTFCGTGLSLRTQMTDANAKLKAQLAANASPASIAASAKQDAAAIAVAAAAATNRMREAGDPSVDQGKGIELAAITLFDGVQSQAEANETTASGISGSSAEALTATLGPYSKEVADLSGRLARSFTYVQDYKGYPDIEKASRTPDPETHVDETCAKLQATAP